jgi:rare lipoprotein A (peptidoglycan hydrolase)
MANKFVVSTITLWLALPGLATADPISERQTSTTPIAQVSDSITEIGHMPSQVGTASWYGRWHAGRLTANGERFNPQAMTCAHRTLPLGSVIKVTDLATGKNVSLHVNDRGPYVRGRIIDLSERAAMELGVGDRGLLVVRIEVVSIAQRLSDHL